MVRIDLDEGPGRDRGQAYSGGGLVHTLIPAVKGLDDQSPELVGARWAAESGDETLTHEVSLLPHRPNRLM